jgi:hypothetical protein
MTARAMTLMTTRDLMDRAATGVMTARSATLISARAVLARAASAITATAHPLYYPLVPDGELLVLGSHVTNVDMVTVCCNGNVQGSCPC